MRNELIVKKLVAYADKVLAYCAGMDYGSFVADTRTVDACVFNISQMGELANKVDKSFAGSHPSIPWIQLYGLRNRIVHDYDGVNLELIWQIIEADLGNLRDQLQAICSKV